MSIAEKQSNNETEYIQKVLLVNDIDGNHTFLEKFFKNCNVTLYSVQKGKATHDIFEKHAFALIIIDVQVDLRNEFEIVDQIRKGKENKHTPLLFLTSLHPDRLSFYNYNESDLIDLITKPFHHQIFASKVKYFLELDHLKSELSKSKREIENIKHNQPDLLVDISEDFKMTKEFKMQKELIYYKLIAENAITSKSQFLANQNHVLRTYMNSINGYTELLMMTDLNIEQRQDVEMIKNSATELMDVFNNQFLISRANTNMVKSGNNWFDIHHELKNIINLFEKKAQVKGNKIELSVLAGVPLNVKGEQNIFRLIIINLLDITLKTVENSSILVNVKKTSTDDKKATVKISINNSGHGLSENITGTQYNLIQTGEPSLFCEYDGIDLNLAMSKCLSEIMDSTIEIIGNLYTGYSICFTVNYELEAVSARKKTRILLVEDILFNQKVIKAMLQKNSITIDIAENGKVAVEKYLEYPYDLILMDIQMPVMDGYEATRLIRDFESKTLTNKKSFIIALTANATDETRERCKMIGMDEFLTKPLKITELKNLLNNFDI